MSGQIETLQSKGCLTLRGGSRNLRMVRLCHICAQSAREIFKTTPNFTSTSPTLPRTRSANMYTSHKSRVTASVLALLVAQAIHWRYSASA